MQKHVKLRDKNIEEKETKTRLNSVVNTRCIRLRNFAPKRCME